MRMLLQLQAQAANNRMFSKLQLQTVGSYMLLSSCQTGSREAVCRWRAEQKLAGRWLYCICTQSQDNLAGAEVRWLSEAGHAAMLCCGLVSGAHSATVLELLSIWRIVEG